MNDSSEIASNITEHPCGITSILPSIGMSCRGRAEAFARRLQTKLKTLGSQNDESPTNEESTILNGIENTWMHPDESHMVQAMQPLRLNHHQNNNNINNINNINKNNNTKDDISDDAYYDFDCEIESPGSPVDECEYTRLVETMSNTPNELENDYGNTANSITLSPINKQVTATQATGPHICGAYLGNFYNNCNTTNITLNDVEKKLENDLLKQMNNCCSNDEAIKNHNEQNMNNKNMEKTQKFFINVQNEEQQDTKDESINLSNHNCCNAKELSNSNGVNSHIESNGPVIETNGIKLESQHLNETTNNQQQQQQKISTSTETETETVKSELTNGKITIDSSECPAESQDVKINACDENKENDMSALNGSSKQNGVCDNNTTTTDEDDDEDLRPQRVRRCSSLKTGKTPPGTPGRKKIVRFADVLGLDLADVKTFLDEIPNVPKSAYQDLEILELEQQQPPIQLGPRSDRMLMPMFQQPGGLPTFLDAVRDKQVNLESATIIDNINFTIAGIARVRNLDFHKSVHLRYTYDHWRTFFDIPARYVQNSCDGFSDKFEFMICCSKLEIGQRLEFALRFQCKGQQFWDNNYGSNYCFQCLPATNLSAASSRYSRMPSHHNNDSTVLNPLNASDAWCISFY